MAGGVLAQVQLLSLDMRAYREDPPGTSDSPNLESESLDLSNLPELSSRAQGKRDTNKLIKQSIGKGIRFVKYFANVVCG